MHLDHIQREQLEFGQEAFPNAQGIMHMCVALAGEVGEFCNIVKKVDRGSLELTPEVRVELVMELADVLIYLVECASQVGLSLQEAYVIKHKFNRERFLNAGSGDKSYVEPKVQRLQSDAYGAGAFVSQQDVLGVLQDD